MFCSNCGKEINDESKFCNFCGKEQTVSKQHKETELVASIGMRLVECDSHECQHVFEIPESLISLESGLRCRLFEKIICPQCNRKSIIVYDHNKSKKALIDEKQKSISCPKCNSTQFHSSDKGFSAGKALVGGVVTGGIGLLAGFHGSKKVVLTCIKCGNKWNV